MRVSLGCHPLHGASLVYDVRSSACQIYAARSRILRRVPTIEESILIRFHRYVRSVLPDLAVPLGADDDASFDTWVTKTHYTKAKKDQLRLLHSQINSEERQRVFKIKAFVKDEAYLSFKYPRAIYARVDEFKCLVGPIFKLIEEAIFKNPCFIKKVPVRDRPAFLRELFGTGEAFVDSPHERKYRVYATDYTSFEVSFCRKFMEVCEFEVYKYMLQHRVEQRWFLDLVEHHIMAINKVRFKYVSFQVHALRMSGENNTSLGNGISNKLINDFVMRENKCDVVAAVFEGDDCLGAYHGPVLTNDLFTSLGFVVKLEYFTNFNVASFCGQIFDLETLTVITDPMKVILNFGWAGSIYAGATSRTLKKLLRGKALSLVYQYPGCPILQEMALAYLRLTHGVWFSLDRTLVNRWYEQTHLSGLKNFYHSGDVPDRPVAYPTRMLFHRVFDFTIDEQLAVEDYFRQMTSISPIDHPVLNCRYTDFQRKVFDMYVSTEKDDVAPNPVNESVDRYIPGLLTAEGYVLRLPKTEA